MWHRALVGDPSNPVAPQRLRLMPNDLLRLHEGWRELPGVDEVARWAAADPQVVQSLWSLWGRLPDALRGDRRITEIFAQARRCGSAAALHAWAESSEAGETAGHAGSTAEVETIEAATAVWTPPASPRFVDELARESATDPELFAWVQPMVDRVPSHARLVTREHRLHGMPAPGSVWWRTRGGTDWLIVTPQLAYEREQAVRPSRDSHRLLCAETSGQRVISSMAYEGVMKIAFRGAQTFRGSQLALTSSWLGYEPAPTLEPGELWYAPGSSPDPGT